ncbi:MAG: hypothetical protein PHQ03_01990 [Methylococcales bacterium]|nr:hypothetical protein [Methylococcales bacterium]
MNLNKNIHSSIIYPREIRLKSEVSAMCPACKSNKIKVISHAPERAFKRQSNCTDCGTVWATRNTRLPLPYEQRFYQ